MVFLTSGYNNKIKSGYEDGETNWCYYEFNYASTIVSPKNIILVVLEEEMLNRRNWTDAIAAQFANQIVFPLLDVTNTEDYRRLIDLIIKIKFDLPVVSFQQPVIQGRPL
jgi:hypothetical protein